MPPTFLLVYLILSFVQWQDMATLNVQTTLTIFCAVVGTRFPAKNSEFVGQVARIFGVYGLKRENDFAFPARSIPGYLYRYEGYGIKLTTRQIVKAFSADRIFHR